MKLIRKKLFLLIMLYSQSIFAQSLLNTPETNKKATLTLADTIQYLRQKGDTCMMQLNYNLATFYYRKLLEINLSDSHALRKLKEAEHVQKSNCKNDLTQAEKLFYRKAYIKAKPFYEKVVEQECDFSIIANERLLQIENILKSKEKDVGK